MEREREREQIHCWRRSLVPACYPGPGSSQVNKQQVNNPFHPTSLPGHLDYGLFQRLPSGGATEHITPWQHNTKTVSGWHFEFGCMANGTNLEWENKAPVKYNKTPLGSVGAPAARIKGKLSNVNTALLGYYYKYYVYCYNNNISINMIILLLSLLTVSSDLWGRGSGS